MFIDAHLTGANTLEFVVARRDGAPLTGRRRPAHGGLRTGNSGATRHHRRQPAFWRCCASSSARERGREAALLPDNERDTALRVRSAGSRARARRLLRQARSRPTSRTARFNVRLRAVGTAVAAPLANAIAADGSRIFGHDYQLDSTGAFYHIAQDSEPAGRRAGEQLLASALVFVFVTIGLLFRSFSSDRDLAHSLRHAAPLDRRIDGAVGIDLSTGTAMIASAVLGLVVDDTIHYLAHFFREYRGDASRRRAPRRRQTSARALVTNNSFRFSASGWAASAASSRRSISR